MSKADIVNHIADKAGYRRTVLELGGNAAAGSFTGAFEGPRAQTGIGVLDGLGQRRTWVGPMHRAGADSDAPVKR